MLRVLFSFLVSVCRSSQEGSANRGERLRVRRPQSQTCALLTHPPWFCLIRCRLRWERARPTRRRLATGGWMPLERPPTRRHVCVLPSRPGPARTRSPSLTARFSPLCLQTASSALQGAIQLGIGYTVGNLSSKAERDVLMQDFYVVESIFFPRCVCTSGGSSTITAFLPNSHLFSFSEQRRQQLDPSPPLF